jgi:hypothetical protein
VNQHEIRRCGHPAYLQMIRNSKQTKGCLFVHFPYWTLREREGAWFDKRLAEVQLHHESHSCARSLPPRIYGLVQLSRYSDSLRAGRSDDQIPVGARFSVPVQTGPGAQPASCTMGTGSFRGVKRSGRDTDHPSHLAPRLKKELCCTSTPPL